MKQPIYNDIDKLFANFVTNNKQLFTAPSYNKIINITNEDNIKKINYYASVSIDKKPFNVTYIVKIDIGIEVAVYFFFDKNMNNVYIYQDI